MYELGKIARRITVAVFVVLSLTLSAQAKYSGGSGTARDPYRIADHNDLYALADSTSDYNKCFIQTSDIDLDPNLPGRRILTRALIAPDTSTGEGFQGARFTGAFDGNNRQICNFRINGRDFLGLFGFVDAGGSVSNLGLGGVSITGTGWYVGGLVGYGYATTNVTNCYATGAVSGGSYVGGLVGHMIGSAVASCYAGGVVVGKSSVGGLLGAASYNVNVTNCYATGAISGNNYVGGLVGYASYSTVTNCYATSAVSGGSDVGGLVGHKSPAPVTFTSNFWDMNVCGTSDGVGNVNPDPNGAMGRTTTQMMTRSTFTDAGWDFNTPVWVMWDGHEYPWLAWEGGFVVVESINVVGRQRVGRTVFRYVCKANLRNISSLTISDVSATLTGVPDNVTIVDGNVGCASIGPFGSAESDDTFTIEVDRSMLIEPTEMTWHISYSYDDGTGRTIYETATSTTLFEQTADITGDGTVDIDDLTSLVSKWLWQGQPGEIIQDIYQDGRVDLLDLCELATNWAGQ